jgi:two-component system sensor histidine kinase HydH
MAAGIAHEVRNPLMTIKLLVQAAADRCGGSAFKARELQILEEEIVRLEQIVAGFLDFARPPRPALRPVDLTPLVEQAAENHRVRGDLQSVRISVEVPSAPVVVLADPNQIRQVVYNLIANALDAQPGGGEVVIHLLSGEEVELAVEDDGPGLPHELGERVFEPFVSTRDSGWASACPSADESSRRNRGLIWPRTDREAGRYSPCACLLLLPRHLLH